MPNKGTLYITGGSNGIGKDILDVIGSRYASTCNFDASEGNDVRDLALLEQSMDKVLSSTLQNDLVIAAGVFRPLDFLEQSKDDIDFVVDTNLKGALYAIHAFLNWHTRHRSDATPNIVIISSISAFFHGGRTNVAYDATKAALSFLVKDIANYPCVVNAVQPGTVRDTDIGAWKSDFTKDPDAKSIVDAGQTADVKLLGKEVSKADVTHAVEWLLFSNQWGMINGTAITVDGGLTAMKQRF